MQGNAGDDVIDGGGGNDAFYGGTGNDDIRGGPGQDELQGQEDNDLLRGDGDNDKIQGGTGNDDQQGGDGDDVFREIASFSATGPDGADTMAGGPGIDRTDYGAYTCAEYPPFGGGPGFGYAEVWRTTGVTADLDGVADDGAPGEGDRIGTDVEALSGTNAADHLTGNGQNNVLLGFGGGDVLRGGAGADRLEGVHGPCQFGDVFTTTLPDGNDDLDGEGGADVVNGDIGDDKIGAVDGVVDTINCGAGDDTANPRRRGRRHRLRGRADPTPTPTPGPAAPGPATPVSQPPPPVVASKAPKVSSLIDRPATKKCVSRRRLRLRVKRSIVGQVRSVSVFVSGKRKSRITGRRLKLPVDLRGLPKGRFKVKLVVVLRDGRTTERHPPLPHLHAQEAGRLEEQRRLPSERRGLERGS